jgi:hypothetical protein
MRRILRSGLLGRRPSPAMIVACLALLIALGGTSVAAVSQLTRNSVGPLQLKNGAVTNPKIRNNAVTSAKVRNRSLLRSDFAPGQLPAGPTGPQGPAGAAGPAGPAGPAGGIGAITVRSQAQPIADTTDNDEVYGTAEVSALCNSGELAASGGAGWSDSNSGLELFLGRLRPVTNSSNQVIGFLASGLNDTGQSSTFTVYSLCYTP